MKHAYGFRANQPISWFAKNKRRSNQHCLYCGSFVGQGSPVPSNREHLVARSFVPDGTLDSRAPDFIFRACVECNTRKADAERHVSTVTLYTSQGRSDPAIDELAVHKAAEDFHPNTRGGRVRDAILTKTIENKIGEVTFSFGLVGPPQLDQDRALFLAFTQIQALFALVASSNPMEPDGTTLLPSDQWHYFGIFPARDWGNPQLVELANRVQHWPAVAQFETANSYFKAVVRPNPSNSDEWFWALEWNRSVRVLGAIYSGDVPPSIFDSLPNLDWKAPGPNRRIREEIALAAGQPDLLFVVANSGPSS